MYTGKSIFKIQGFSSFLLVWCREWRMRSILTRKQIGVFFRIISCSWEKKIRCNICTRTYKNLINHFQARHLWLYYMFFFLSMKTISSISAIDQDVVWGFFCRLSQNFRNNEECRHYYDCFVPFKTEKSYWFLNSAFWIQTVSRWTGQLESRRKKKINPERC